MASEIGTPGEPMHTAAALIAKSVVVRGEVEGSEDLTVEGQVEGKVELRDHTLTIGLGGRVKAQVSAKTVVVCGEMAGTINAGEVVDIRESGRVDGDIVSPRVVIADGAHFRGNIDMQRKSQPPARAAVSPGVELSTPWRFQPSSQGT
jgi:cytoskeletal protein CcmA (bactofilin family)